ncbi:MAG: YaiI/YqxD family protein [Dehalococcoidales bacterium]
MPDILVDADACPVKQEVYRVAKRYGLKVMLVANSPMNIPQEDGVSLAVVNGQLDAADNWIVDHAARNDIVITGDIPLAARCLKIGARVLEPKGYVFTETTISNALANRDLMTYLRNTGIATGGPASFKKRDRSMFLHSLDKVIRAILDGK